jgi:hypothetical protein
MRNASSQSAAAHMCAGYLNPFPVGPNNKTENVPQTPATRQKNDTPALVVLQDGEAGQKKKKKKKNTHI